MPSDRDRYLAQSREALRFAEENLRGAIALKSEGLDAQGFGLLLYAAEESTKSAIYLYANLDLVTFDRRDALSKLYFNENWLLKHKKKYDEFARGISANILGSAFLSIIGAAKDGDDAVATVLVVLLIVGIYFQAWGDRFEELREMAFLSGMPTSGKTDVERPGRKEFAALEPAVRAEIERLGGHLRGTLDRETIAGDLPSPEVWQRFIVNRPRNEDLWSELMKLAQKTDVKGGPD